MKKKISLIVGEENDFLELEQRGYFLTIGNLINSNKYIYIYSGYNDLLITYYSKDNKKSITFYPKDLKGDEVGKAILSLKPKSGDDNNLYVALDYLFVQSAINKTKNSKLNLFFKNTTENDNPCIVSYKIRDF